MQVLRLCVGGDFNSFRIAGDMRYQDTYFYPPKTTVIGLLGAAFGLDDTELEPLYDETLVGVIIDERTFREFGGKAMDLWTIAKPKAAGEAESAVIIRDLLFNMSYWIYLRSKHHAPEDLKQAFLDPVYALTLGRSDELIKVKSNDIVNLAKAEQNAIYRWTVLPFDYRKKRYEFEKKEIYQGTTPQVFKIPSAFSYDKRVRDPRKYEFCTHVFDIGVRIKDSIGWRDDDKYFFMY